MIDLRHLQNFIAVMDAGGVRQAAPIVHSSASSISRSLQHLEDHFGVRLFERQGKRLVPTSLAETLRGEAEELLSRFDSLLPNVAQSEVTPSGLLRVGVNPTVVDVFLPTVAARFLKECPRVQLSTTVRDASGLIELMLAGELDLIVGYERLFALQKRLEITRLYEASVLWWVRKEHPLLSRSKVTMGDFADYPVISQHLPRLYMERFFDLCLAAEGERDSGSVNHAHQIDDYPALCRMALESDAILLSPEHNIVAGGYTGRLRRLHAPTEMPDAVISAAVPSRPSDSSLSQLFLKCLKEAIRATLPEDDRIL